MVALSCTSEGPATSRQCAEGEAQDPATGLCIKRPYLKEVPPAAPLHVSDIRTGSSAVLAFDPVWGRYLFATGPTPDQLQWSVPLVRLPQQAPHTVLSLYSAGGDSPYSLLVESEPGQLALLRGRHHNFQTTLLPKRDHSITAAWHAYDAGGGAQFVVSDTDGRLHWTQTVQGNVVEWTPMVVSGRPDLVPVGPAALFRLGGRIEIASAARPEGLLVMHRGTGKPWESSVVSQDSVASLAAAGRGDQAVVAWVDCNSGALRYAMTENSQLLVKTIDPQAFPADCATGHQGGFGLLAPAQSSTVLVAYYRSASSTVRLVEIRQGKTPATLSETPVPGPMVPAIGLLSDGSVLGAGVVTTPGQQRGIYSSFRLY